MKKIIHFFKNLKKIEMSCKWHTEELFKLLELELFSFNSEDFLSIIYMQVGKLVFTIFIEGV